MSTDLASLAEQVSSLSKADAVELLKANNHAAWQEIWNAGHNTAHGKAKESEEAIQSQLEEAQAELEKTQKELEKIQSKQPDVAKIHEDYKAEIDALKTKHKEAIASKDQTIRDRELDRGKSSLRAALVATGVDPDFAEVMVQKENVLSRLRVDGDFHLNVLQDGREIPIQPNETKDAVQLFAEELKATVPPKFVAASGDRGSGSKRPGSVGGGDHFANLRERISKEREAARSQSGSAEQRLQERLGMVRE
jgi:hypothetical protein